MKRLIVTFSLLLLLGWGLQAQTLVSVNEPPEVTRLMERFIELNRMTGQVSGWRIQLMATTDRNRLEEAQRSFQFRYPNISVDWTHEPPYFKLRAGAYSNKLEALRIKEILKTDYPSAYVAPDNNIRPEELIGF